MYTQLYTHVAVAIEVVKHLQQTNGLFYINQYRYGSFVLSLVNVSCFLCMYMNTALSYVMVQGF